MARTAMDESATTLAGGRKGMMIGAAIGALLFLLAHFVMDLMRVGTGGPGLGVMTGLVVGGLAGTLVGALRARHGGHRPHGR